MFWIIVEITIVIMTLFLLLQTKRLYHPGVLFLSFWAILVFLTKLQLFGLKMVSDKIITVIFAGCISFFIGSILKSRKIVFVGGKTNKNHDESQDDKDLIPLNGTVFFVLLFICAASLLYRFSFQWKYILMGYSISDIRYMGIVTYTHLAAIIFNFFSLPFLDAALTVLITKNVLENKGIKRYVLPLLLLFLSGMSNGARLAVFQAGVIVLFSFIITQKLSWFYVKRLIIIFACFIAFVAYINVNRNSSVSLFENIYSYFCGGLVLGDQVLVDGSYFNEYLYGFNSFNGVLRPFFTVSGLVGISEPVLLEKAGEFMASSMQNTVISISDKGGMFNYFCTCFVYFFKDGGYIAVAVISFIYGRICKYSYSKMINELSTRSLSLYLYIISGIFISMMHFCFASFIYTMTFFYIWLLTSKTKQITIYAKRT